MAVKRVANRSGARAPLSVSAKAGPSGEVKKVRDRDDGLYRVERIIKAKLPPEKLAEVRDQIKRRLPEIDDETEEEDA